MKNKVIALLLTFALALTSFNFVGSASYWDTGTESKQVKQLQKELDQLKKDNEIYRLKEALNEIQNDKNAKSKESTTNQNSDPSILEIIAGIVKASLGFIFGITATIFVTAPISILAFAASDCSKDEKCHFDDKTFLDKVKENANWEAATLPVRFVLQNSKFILNN